MKVIHFIADIDRKSGGTSMYMQTLGGALGKSIDLHIVTHKTDHMLEIDNCHVHYIPYLLLTSMKKEWIKLLDEIQPDLVHINGCWLPQLSLIQRWTQKRGIKVVLSPHGMLEPWIIQRNYWTRKLPSLILYQRHALKKADCIHVTGQLEYDNIVRFSYNSNIHIIPNGICLEDIEVKDSWANQSSILFLSRLHPKKGIDVLLKSIHKIKEHLKDNRIILAGEGDPSYIKSLKELSIQLGIEEYVDFIGGVYNEKKWELIKDSRVFVLPTHSENFGIVVAEALASGTPVITTKGTPWDGLEEYNCGWWINLDAETLSKKILEAISLSETEIETMGKNGRKLVEEKYSISTVAQQMKSLYEWILSGENKPNFVN